MHSENQIVNRVKINLKRFCMEEKLHKKNFFQKLSIPKIMITPDFSNQSQITHNKIKNNSKNLSIFTSKNYPKEEMEFSHNNNEVGHLKFSRNKSNGDKVHLFLNSSVSSNDDEKRKIFKSSDKENNSINKMNNLYLSLKNENLNDKRRYSENAKIANHINENKNKLQLTKKISLNSNKFLNENLSRRYEQNLDYFSSISKEETNISTEVKVFTLFDEENFERLNREEKKRALLSFNYLKNLSNNLKKSEQKIKHSHFIDNGISPFQKNIDEDFNNSLNKKLEEIEIDWRDYFNFKYSN